MAQKDLLQSAVHVGKVNWCAGKLRKLCSECGEPMRLAADYSVPVMDVYPEVVSFNWHCPNKHIEDAGGMSRDKADELDRIFGLD